MSVNNRFLSIALLSLSLSIAYFAYAIIDFGSKIPQVVSSVEQVNKKLPMILKELAAYKKMIPDILAETKAYREQIPILLPRIDRIHSQLDAIRLDIPMTLDKTLPPVLARIDKLQVQINQLFEQLPAIYKVMNSTSKVIDNSNKQISEIVRLIPPILEESKMLREDIPGYLARAEELVSNIDSTSEQAGKGAVTGFIKGIVSVPFTILRTPAELLGSKSGSRHLFNDEDFKLAHTAGKKAVSLNKIGASEAWRNPATRNKGKITIIKIYEHKGKPCRTLKIEMSPKKGKREIIERDICQNEKDKWDFVN